MTLCACGCGREVKSGNKYINGHQNIGRTRDKKDYICYVCGTNLNVDNWTPYRRANIDRICKRCANQISKAYRIKNQPNKINKECSLYLGCYIAERLLSLVFKDVKRMPPNNPGYDFICNHGKKIDVKASCIRGDISRPNSWTFNTNQNDIADYFLCVAFDNRDKLNPLYIWLLPSKEFGYLKAISISTNTLDGWSKYELSPDKVISCCDSLR